MELNFFKAVFFLKVVWLKVYDWLRAVSRAADGEFGNVVTLVILCVESGRVNIKKIVYWIWCSSLTAATKLFQSGALAVCIQGTNEEGFLDVFLTLVAFPTFRLSFSFFHGALVH